MVDHIIQGHILDPDNVIAQMEPMRAWAADGEVDAAAAAWRRALLMPAPGPGAMLFVPQTSDWCAPFVLPTAELDSIVGRMSSSSGWASLTQPQIDREIIRVIVLLHQWGTRVVPDDPDATFERNEAAVFLAALMRHRQRTVTPGPELFGQYGMMFFGFVLRCKNPENRGLLALATEYEPTGPRKYDA